jgi:DNA-binding NarL/FixJ family response regulator
MENMSSSNSYLQPTIRVTRFTPGIPKVLVLHEAAIVGELLVTMLADQIEVVAVTQSGRAAVALSELFVPDVVVAGTDLVDGVVESYVPALLQTGTRVLLLPDPQETAPLLSFVELGITGIVDGDQPPLDLAHATLALAAGGAFLPPDVVSSIATDWRRMRRRSGQNSFDGELTSRELEVLGAMTDGLSTKAVAHQLGIAIKTVENHKTRIFDKLGVRTQAQAVALVIGEGERTPVNSAQGQMGRRLPST